MIANIDTDGPRALINTRLIYVAVSRSSHDARIYTNDAAALGTRLATDITKTAAVDFGPHQPRRVEDLAVTRTAELREAVAAFGRNEVSKGTQLLQQQGRIRQFDDPNHRVAAIAMDYVKQACQ